MRRLGESDRLPIWTRRSSRGYAVFVGLDRERALANESILLERSDCTIIHSTHVLFAENLLSYDAVYGVQERAIHRLSSEEIQDLLGMRH